MRLIQPGRLASSPDPPALGFGPAQSDSCFRSRPRRTEICESESTLGSVRRIKAASCKRDLRAYCAARGFDLVREYVDVGQLCAKDSRPELNKLIDDARKRQVDANVVWRFDRLS